MGIMSPSNADNRQIKATIQNLVDTLGDGSPSWRSLARWLEELYERRTGEPTGVPIPEFEP